MRSTILRILTLLLALLVFNPAQASHLEGGVMTYAYLGDSTSAGITYARYLVSLSIYEDCLSGDQQAVAQDNPAFFSAYNITTGNMYMLDTNVFFSSSISVPAVYTNACGSGKSPVSLCQLQKTFIKHYAFPANTHGYIISYQRCCLNASLVNILNPGTEGCTLYCTIPPSPTINNSAVFKNPPAQVICLNRPLYYDNSATDVDGDSLSYGFCAPLNSVNPNDIKPIPEPPPYDSVAYIAPNSSQSPFPGSIAITIDPVTGLITGTPNQIGRYLIAVYCKEWRAGVLINTVIRESELVVADCPSDTYSPLAGPDTIIFAGASVQFFSSQGTSYSWSPSTYLNDASISNPVGTFTHSGTFTYTLHITSDSGCDGSRTVTIQVLDYSSFFVPTGFTPNGDNLNDVLAPVPVLGSTLISFKIFDRKGKLIFNGGPNTSGWDGTYKGVKQDIGTYYWELLYYDNAGATRRTKGDVTLIR